MEANEKAIKILITSNGKRPFDSWFRSLKDKRARALILSRIDRIRLGNFGNCKSVGSGVYELKIYYGSGFRIYFGLETKQVVLLISGGDKASQKSDILQAKQLWKEFKNDG